MIDTVLFDLDGTLLPFEQKEFIDAYFSRLCRALAPLGFSPREIVDAVWAGTAAMVKNDGGRSNKDVFWQEFTGRLGENARKAEALCDRFYAREFDEVKCVVRPGSPAKELVRALTASGFTVALATNPIFPAVAVRTRLSWIGLSPEDFALVTDYENSCFCKPNPRYFTRILECLGKRGDHCLMVGNSPQEDLPAAEAGCAVFLITDYLEPPGAAIPDGVPHASLASFTSSALSALHKVS